MVVTGHRATLYFAYDRRVTAEKFKQAHKKEYPNYGELQFDNTKFDEQIEKGEIEFEIDDFEFGVEDITVH